YNNVISGRSWISIHVEGFVLAKGCCSHRRSEDVSAKDNRAETQSSQIKFEGIEFVREGHHLHRRGCAGLVFEVDLIWKGFRPCDITGYTNSGQPQLVIGVL